MDTSTNYATQPKYFGSSNDLHPQQQVTKTFNQFLSLLSKLCLIDEMSLMRSALSVSVPKVYLEAWNKTNPRQAIQPLRVSVLG